MSNIDKVQDVIERYIDGKEDLDQDQLVGMLEAALDGLQNCDAEGAGKLMLECAGYSVR